MCSCPVSFDHLLKQNGSSFQTIPLHLLPSSHENKKHFKIRNKTGSNHSFLIQPIRDTLHSYFKKIKFTIRILMNRVI